MLSFESKLMVVAMLSTLCGAQVGAETEFAKLTASDGEFEDNFGGRLAIDGDTLIVGENEDDEACVPPDEGCNSGAAYVFQRNESGAWQEVAKLTAMDAEEGDSFGEAVDVQGDIAIVGSPNSGDGGAAYVFYRDLGGPDAWGQHIRLTGSDAALGDRFGTSVAVYGSTVAVGDTSDDDLGTSSGAVYIFYQDAGGPDAWAEHKKLTASDGAASDFFGRVALSGDFLISGAVGDESLTGAAYIFARDHGGANNWGEVKKLIASDGVAGDWFGHSGIAIDGDTALVGAHKRSMETGSAYLFERSFGGPDNWGEVAELVAFDGVSEDRFGTCAAVAGDSALIGAYGDDDGGSGTGSVYLFQRGASGTNGWGFVDKLSASDADPLDLLGIACAASGTVALVGSSGDDDVAAHAGAAYLFHLPVFFDGFESGDTSRWTSP